MRAKHDNADDRQILENFLATLSAKDSRLAATGLLVEFGSISEVLAGSWWRLRSAVGPRLAHAIVASRVVMCAALAERIAERPLMSSSQALLDFLRFEISFLEREQLLVIYLDHQARLIRIVRSEEGRPCQTPIDIARIMRDGLNFGAAGFVLVHNHPSGDPRPSDADRWATDQLRRVAADLDMPLIDHLIVARGKIWSFSGSLHAM